MKIDELSAVFSCLTSEFLFDTRRINGKQRYCYAIDCQNTISIHLSRFS